MCNHHRNPFHCVIPPYMQKKLDKNASEKEVEQEIDNRLRDHRLRSDRKFIATLTPVHRKALAIKKVAAPKPKPIIEVYSCERAYSLHTKMIMSRTDKTSKDKDA